MSAISLLFDSAIEYERTHQVVLYTLLSQSDFCSYLIGLPGGKVLWEPQGQLFDLAVESEGGAAVFIELKMWNSLAKEQRDRQDRYLRNNERRGAYVLLGTSWFEYAQPSLLPGVCSLLIGYPELISSLNRLLVSPAVAPDVSELALAYRDVLQRQLDRLTNAAMGNNDGSKIYYYSLYRRLQKSLPAINTELYTVNNPGGPVYILNDKDAWHQSEVLGVKTDLYFEIVNGTLCIKFRAEADDTMKRQIREVLRKSIRNIFGQHYHVVNAGRLGEYMTACQIVHSFSSLDGILESSSIFNKVHDKLPEVMNSAKNARVV